MVENLSQPSAKIIVETNDFLTEMISESLDSPPTSPTDRKSDSKPRDCLKVAQTNNKLAKRARVKHQPSSKDKTKKLDVRKEAGEAEKLSHRSDASNEKSVKCSKDSVIVTTKEISKNRNDTNEAKRKKKKETRARKRYEEIVIENVTINAFKTWEDLQDELNEQISAERLNNQRNRAPLSPTDFDYQGSTSQASFEPRKSTLEDQRVPQVPIEDANKQANSDSVREDKPDTDEVKDLPQACDAQNVPAHEEVKQEHKKKRRRGRDDHVQPDRNSSARRDARDNERVFEYPRATEWIPQRDLYARCLSNEKDPSFIARDTSLPHPIQPISGPNSHRINSSLHPDRLELESEFNRIGHRPFGPPLVNLPGEPIGYNFHHHNPSAAFGPQVNTTNQYLHQYFNTNLYSQHPRENQHQFGLPPTNQPFLPPHNPMLASSSFATPYASPYTITDTIISRQTIIPPPISMNHMGAVRYSHFSPPPSALEHGPAALLKQSPNYMPSPTERSFMEFARSYASANNMSSLMSPPPSSGMVGGGIGASHTNFGPDQRTTAAIAASNALGGLQYSEAVNRFGISPYHNDARSTINAGTSFYPQHYFR